MEFQLSATRSGTHMPVKIFYVTHWIEDNLPPSSADDTESESLNLPEPSGLEQQFWSYLSVSSVTVPSELSELPLEQAAGFLNLLKPTVYVMHQQV
jgi:hypothetical protein